MGTAAFHTPTHRPRQQLARPRVTPGERGHVRGKERIPFFRPKIHMVSRASISVRPRPNHSLKDLDTGFSSSWPQANLRYPAHAWRKASITALWRSFGEAGGKRAGRQDRCRSGFRQGPSAAPHGTGWGSSRGQRPRSGPHGWTWLPGRRGLRGQHGTAWPPVCLHRGPGGHDALGPGDHTVSARWLRRALRPR